MTGSPCYIIPPFRFRQTECAESRRPSYLHGALPMLRHRVVATDLEQLPVFEPYRSHRSAPQAAGIERDDIVPDQQAERRPVSEDHR